MSRHRRLLLILVVLALSVASALPAVAHHAPPPGDPDERGEPEVPGWTPAADASVRPGVQVNSPSGGCTSNFVFHDHDAVYLGFAAHCVSTSGSTTTNGCRATSLPLGTEIRIEGATFRGTLAYSGWLTMLQRGEQDSSTCAYNDFALIEVDPDDVARVNPSVQHYGGPQGIRTATTASGEKVYSYGNSSLRFGLSPLSPKEGWSTGSRGQGWSHSVYTITPGVPGDSGSAFLDDEGRALGVVVTLSADGSNGVTDLHRAMTYAQQHWNPYLRLAEGTEAFAGGLLP